MQHHPTDIKMRTASRVLEVSFSDDSQWSLSFEYLRVYSPSAEVRGHGPGQETLQVGKQEVMITKIEAVGSYAIRLVFDDGHNSGIYSWDVLYELGQNQEKNWQEYLDKMAAAGASRSAVGQQGSH